MDNSKENIQRLLDSYWAGETSLVEESMLNIYFTTQNHHEEFKIFAPLFLFFSDERKQTVNLEDSILSKIQSKPLTRKVEPVILRMNWQRVAAIAASIIFIVFLGINTYQNQQQKQQQSMALTDTFENPEQALEQTKAALLFLSSRMNKGTDKATKSISKTQNLNILN